MSDWMQWAPWIALVAFVLLGMTTVALLRAIKPFRRGNRSNKHGPDVRIGSIGEPHLDLRKDMGGVSLTPAGAAGLQTTEAEASHPELAAAWLEYSDEDVVDSCDVAAQTDRLDTTVSAMVCAECHGLFDVGALFCPLDGQPLDLVETDAIAGVGEEMPTMVCSDCGRIRDASRGFCPSDGARLVPSEPLTRAYIPVPIMFCPSCHQEQAPELSECPDDGTMLVTMLGRRSCGLPSTGCGPKRKICPECGVRYATGMSFCARDQTKLVNLN